MRVRTIMLGAALLLSSACSRPENKFDAAAYNQEIEKWKSERAADLRSEEGWLTLAGLFWLKEGENKVGSERSNEVVLPEGKAPKVVCSLWLERGSMRLEPRPESGLTEGGKPVTGTLALKSDADEAPTRLSLGSLSFYVIKRGERFGVRLKDKESPERQHFAGLDYYPADPKWRLEAKLQPYNPPRAIPITNVLGMTEDMISPGALVFDVAGKTYRLDAVEEQGSKQYFLIFADETTGRETYGAGRYLYADPADAAGRVIVDFNKAYNPPCAFTNYATCPLPPSQNRLALRIEAGEKRYAASTH